MPFYIRKAVRFGPLRFNLSKSGIGVSAGVTGARVGIGPRGAYVHGGRHGLYYRKWLSSAQRAPGDSGKNVPESRRLDEPPLEVIDSADVSELTDASSAELLSALNGVEARTPAVLVASVAGGGILVAALLAGAPTWAFLALVLTAAVVLPFAVVRDRKHGRVDLFYEDEPASGDGYGALCDTFRALVQCAVVRLVDAEGASADIKRNAGAAISVRTRPVRPSFGLPRRVQSNLLVPVLPAGKETLYFFPDRVLVYSGGRVGAVAYDDLHAVAGTTEFVEGATPPADAEVVRTTWRFVNKDGTRDRRFRDNSQLAVVRYGVLDLTSSSGLRERFHASRPQAVQAVARALREMRRLEMQERQKLGSVQPLVP